MRRGLTFAACLLLLVGLRWPSLHEPPDRDIATYAVIGRELNLGRTLYDDLWDHKPPPIHWVYAAANRFAGEDPWELALAWFFGSSLVVLGLFRAGRRMGGDEAAVLSALLGSTVAADLFLQANLANTELLVNAGLIWGVALLPDMESSEDADRNLWAAACAGLCFGLAILAKPVAVLPAAAIGAACAGLRFSRRGWRAVPELAVLAAATAVPWVATALVFAGASRWTAFSDAVFRYNAWYGGDLTHNLLRGLHPLMIIPFASATLVVLLAAAATALLAHRRSSWWIVAAWLIATPLAVALPGRFYNHYYQLWLPGLTLAAALGLTGLPLRKSLRATIGAVVLGALLLLQLPSLALSAEEWSRAQFGSVFVDASQEAQRIRPLAEPGAWAFVWGDAAEIYWAAHLRPASGVLATSNLTRGPLRGRLTSSTLASLGQRKPAVVLLDVSDPASAPSDHPVLEWIGARYEPAPAAFQKPPYLVLVPRDDRRELSARYGSSEPPS